MRTLVLFPHQLFAQVVAVASERVVLIEDELFFTRQRFHRQKLALHRASMEAFADTLARHGKSIEIRRIDQFPTTESALAGLGEIAAFDPVDDWLERRLHRFVPGWERLQTPMFLSPDALLEKHFQRSRASMASFYQDQRRRLQVLTRADGSPIGGQWSFDPENRRKLPRNYPVPSPNSEFGATTRAVAETIDEQFPSHPGQAIGLRFPVTHAGAEVWLDRFLGLQLAEFGPFEDAISREHSVLFHSQLTPMLNTGLLTPDQILNRTLDHAARFEIPLPSLEGFIRQIIGWREFMRGAYVFHGRAMRTRNFLGFYRKLSPAFWTGETGLLPADIAIRRCLDTGYVHHIERLMVLGSLMLMLRVHPDEVYRWFMEMTLDAYDWVMVPNVYGMSQYADGGRITTKPYLSGSNYLRKMSDYPAGEWVDDWDALFWTFVDDHRSLFRGNLRTAAMVANLDKKAPAVRLALRERAAGLISRLTVEGS